MANKKYKFPKGTTKISGKEMEKVLCNYEVVEIPGSVMSLTIRPSEYESSIIAQQLILNEGTQSAVLGGSKNIDYNIPNSLTEIDCPVGYRDFEGFMAPRILCLPETFRRVHGLRGVEYLQAHSTSEVRYFALPNLKHYNYLGEKMNPKQYLFDNLPAGCVIHVETKKMAKSVLKKVNVDKVYVVPDAAEWKDFPADKLAMTLEEYDPESKILPEQKKMREEREQERIEQEKLEQEEIRQRKKESIMEDMSKQVIEPVLGPLFGTYEHELWNKQVVARPAYKVDIAVNEASGDNVLSLTALVEHNLWQNEWNKSMAIEFRLLPTDVSVKLNDISRSFNQIKKFTTDNKDKFSKYNLYFTFDNFLQDKFTPGLSLPFQDSNIVAQLNVETIKEDVDIVTEFVCEFSTIINKVKDSFPLGFYVKSIRSI